MMNYKKELTNTLGSINLALSKKKYKITSLISGLVVFGILYYLLVINVANNSLRISILMSGSSFIFFSFLTILITSLLFGVLFSMSLFKYDFVGGGNLFGFLGSGVTALGTGCPTCGAFLFGLVGMPLVLMYLPFKGLELQILGVFILFISIYLTGKSIRTFCKIK